nr:hypothetical protein [uncultured Cohaesibacter sp.]
MITLPTQNGKVTVPKLVTANCPLGGGVSMTMRPATSFEYRAAQDRAGKMLDAYLESADALAPFGLPPDLLSGASEDNHSHLVTGLTQVLVAVFVAEMVVTDWSGVGDESGDPLPLSQQALCALFQDGAFLHAFEQQAFQRIFLEETEGKS